MSNPTYSTDIEDSMLHGEFGIPAPENIHTSLVHAIGGIDFPDLEK
jgi:hypothetical protein